MGFINEIIERRRRRATAAKKSPQPKNTASDDKTNATTVSVRLRLVWVNPKKLRR